jgi:hypothetical protein
MRKTPSATERAEVLISHLLSGRLLNDHDPVPHNRLPGPVYVDEVDARLHPLAHTTHQAGQRIAADPMESTCRPKPAIYREQHRFGLVIPGTAQGQLDSIASWLCCDRRGLWGPLRKPFRPALNNVGTG